MANVPVNLMDTGGRLTLPGSQPVPPRTSRTAPTTVTAAPPESSDKAKEEASHVHKIDSEMQACKHCGGLPNVEPNEPEVGDTQKFRDAVFMGELYNKTVLIFGTAQVTFRDLTADEELASQQAVMREFSSTNASRLEVVSRLTELRVGLATRSIVVGDRRFTSTTTEDPFTADLDAEHKALRKWCGSDTLYRSVRNAYVKFHETLTLLIFRSGNPSFFTATGSGGVSPASPRTV